MPRKNILSVLLAIVIFTASADTFYSTIYSSMIVKGYKAKVEFNGQKCSFRQDLFRFIASKPSQYNLTDSCFFLTFELSPLACNKGEKTAMSVFVALDSLPKTGISYPLVSIPESPDPDNNPIVRWTSDIGDIAAIQMSHMPVCNKANSLKGKIPESHQDERIILNSTEISDGYIRFDQIEPYSKGSPDYYIKLHMAFNGLLTGGDDNEIEMPVTVRKAEVTLYLVQKAYIEPLMFPIDYGWGYTYLPKDSFDPSAK